jgi:hypothetical protein
MPGPTVEFDEGLTAQEIAALQGMADFLTRTMNNQNLHCRPATNMKQERCVVIAHGEDRTKEYAHVPSYDLLNMDETKLRYNIRYGNYPVAKTHV